MFRELRKGMLCGVMATMAHSAVMMAGRQMGLMRDQPPKLITRALLPGSRHRPKPGENLFATLGHFGFGTAAGAAYAMLARGHQTPPSVGTAYGLAIWLASYEGWVPRLGILPPVSREHQPGRQVVMAACHIAYGATLAYSLNRLNARKPAGMKRPKQVPTRPAPMPVGATQNGMARQWQR
ncbi:hypothetical protein Aph01nite_06970 [Acrocarpospora phusangensis]|uniref:DUF1440 domain-containing protein n=1 Tax=Acrocarpospora phusangensis TaxID=1070424 RepID=A0A919Q4Y5_9ACTN|nr:DUF6789 family protein [Acrocarpospora phusangensis]GIH22387.1 hypothetical protein Aph01nite_06970 [Acrocarpospora phusangensis]